MKIAAILPTIRPSRLRHIMDILLSLQPPPDYLIIVVPREHLKEVKQEIRKFSLKRTSIYVITQNFNLIEARNKGMALANRLGANLVWFVEDDIAPTNRAILADVERVSSNNRIGILYGEQELVPLDEIQRPLQKSLKAPRGLKSVVARIFLRIHGANGLPYSIPAATLITRLSILKEIGLFYEGFGKTGEWSEPDLIYRILSKGYKAIKIERFKIKHYIASSKYLQPGYWARRVHNFMLYLLRAHGLRAVVLYPLVILLVLGSLVSFVSSIHGRKRIRLDGMKH